MVLKVGQQVDGKYLASSEMWFWRRMEIIWTDHVTNEEVLHKVKDRSLLDWSHVALGNAVHNTSMKER